ncbi:uncharacterized protein LOC142165430 [Nicotiana tabacum]|uniref:Uncharacterized protein LOC142165430 n=2 Tax=Nicotiana TaxID=4085 RepID=A0AC58S533_TOBAC|nr:PREDICTED: uncharacterized protein LOC104249915 [Nicotiana sylvestris]
MEYLSRALKTISMLPDFRFHPMCKGLRLTHLIFVDDLMLFCKGYVSSVRRVIQALHHFGKVSCLTANLDKSSIFIVGEEESIKEELLAITGFSLGTFPIRYRGLPLSPMKWSKIDCQMLVGKITQRITITVT